MSNFTSKVHVRIYDSPGSENDPIEVIATGAHDFCDQRDQDLDTGEGVTIAAHGGGRVWMSWDDVPIVIEMLQQAMKDRHLPPPPQVPARGDGS